MRKVILDCDPGHDDAISIILAASSNRIQIEGITTVAGNVEVEKTTLNALKVCELIGLDVPVARGAEQPLVKVREFAPDIHGDSGLDGPQLPEVPKKTAIEQHAVDFIIEKVMKSDGEITLVPTGPLTNIAHAIQKEPGIVEKIKEIVLMGGGTFGNWTPTAEFNIYVDAEAADIVFNCGVPVTMFGLDVTHQAITTPAILEKIDSIESVTSVFVRDLLVYFTKTYREVFGFEGAPIHDACTIAYLIDESIFEFEKVRVDIETKGEYTYGTTCVDRLNVTGREPNVKFAHSLDFEKFWALLLRALK
ncbi:nucleoside hydrolase [Pseudalkalibacillus hwajinpoensis]|uniref:Nucleoside hydrolase n=1 Tax=Guptibacillus hwajinpoensis TaxID=208199 RepID=A0A4U1MJ92_9BACL|nr:nucleoside hydrolase [Pseudalkalibacillus hwajinpoensis]TKD70877.1 nucleoside hydrolase [Pseudalkalibacillus hwajinpoensis]